MRYKFLEHTADVKFQSYGKSLEEAFVSAAEALKEVIARKIKVKIKEKRKIKVEGEDLGSLLYNFLEEFLFLLDSKRFLLSKIKKIKIIKNKKLKLEAEIAGDKAENYKFTNEVKAVTYNEMFVKKEKGKFICQVVLDV